jgi:carbon storage regulator CsrA
MSRRRGLTARGSVHWFDTRGFEMKIISRRENEGLVIGDDISITVLLIRNDHVRLAVSCPRLTPSYWEETLFLETAEESGALQLSTSRF